MIIPMHIKPDKAKCRQALQKTHLDTVEILFLLPPNIEFEDFVSPPANISTIQKGKKQFGSVITDPPLGVISLSAYVKKILPVHSRCIDFNIELNIDEKFDFRSFNTYFSNKMENQLPEDYSPDYIAISSLFTPAYQSVIDLAEISRKLFPNAFVIAGGNLPTSMFREMLQDSSFLDAVCFGEGEKALLELMQSNNKFEYLETSSTWATHSVLDRKNANLRHDFIWDLDEIPFYDYDMLNLNGYTLNSTASRYAVSDKYELTQDEESHILEENKGKEISKEEKDGFPLPIMTSRGCPFKCTFCASHAAHGRKMRFHSLERVQEDIQELTQRYGVNGVVIQDDHFMADHHKGRPYDIVKNIGEKNLGMFFQNALAIYALDREFLELLKASGVQELVLPVESGSARVLKEEMRKPLQLAKIPEVTKNCREIGIYTDCNIIIGMPGETKKDIDDSRKFLKTIYADWFRIFVATPIPGSEMHQTVLSENLNNTSLLRANYKRAVIETEYLTSNYLQFMTYYMNIELNFIFNSNMRLGRYATALEGFKNVIRIKPDHAIAHFFASRCLPHLNRRTEAQYHLQTAKDISSTTTFWDIYINDFPDELKGLKNTLGKVSGTLKNHDQLIV